MALLEDRAYSLSAWYSGWLIAQAWWICVGCIFICAVHDFGTSIFLKLFVCEGCVMDYFRALPPCFFFLPSSLFTSRRRMSTKDALFLYSSITFNYSAPALTFPRHPYLWKWLDRGLDERQEGACSDLAVLIIQRIEGRNTHQSSREEDPDLAWSV